MHEHELRGDPAVYDHEIEDPRGTRGRRRVADWGVGEELFDRMPSPRRRFTPSEAGRRESHPRESHAREPEAREPQEPRERRFVRGEGASREPAVLDAPTRELVASAREPRRAEPRPEPRGELVPRGKVEGRRTVVIGRQSQLPVRRERPSRTVGERVGHRPDRLAGYAVALGLLLIVIAFLSS